VVKIIDLEYECKALVQEQYVKRGCELISDIGLKEVCYSLTINDYIFLTEEFKPIPLSEVRVYGDIYCIPKYSSVYVINFIHRPGRNLYVLVTKIYGMSVEWRALLLMKDKETFILIRKEGSRRSIIFDLERLLEALMTMYISRFQAMPSLYA